MNVYTVHLKGSPDDPAALERAVFVREGFYWAALVFGPFWLLWRGLWMALIVWLALDAGLVAWSMWGSPASSVLVSLHVLMHVALGFEAAQIRRGALARRRLETVEVVHGRRLMDAERTFFLRAGAQRQLAPVDAPTASRGRTPDMVGLFPSAGA